MPQPDNNSIIGLSCKIRHSVRQGRSCCRDRGVSEGLGISPEQAARLLVPLGVNQLTALVIEDAFSRRTQGTCAAGSTFRLGMPPEGRGAGCTPVGLFFLSRGRHRPSVA